MVIADALSCFPNMARNEKTEVTNEVQSNDQERTFHTCDYTYQIRESLARNKNEYLKNPVCSYYQLKA